MEKKCEKKGCSKSEMKRLKEVTAEIEKLLLEEYKKLGVEVHKEKHFRLGWVYRFPVLTMAGMRFYNN